MFNYNFHWRPVLKSLPDLLEASLLTLQVAALAMIAGIVIGLGLALIRLNMKGPLRWFATAWVELARNTPALFQLFFFGFGLGAFGLHLSPYLIVLMGLTFNCAGYLAENFRGGFQAVPDTQVRAARSLGMTAWQAYTRIIIPQVLRIVYHPITNQMVWAILMTSLGVTVGMNTDLAGVTQDINVRSFRTFEIFAIAAVIYYLLAKAVTLGARLLARRMFRY